MLPSVHPGSPLLAVRRLGHGVWWELARWLHADQSGVTLESIVANLPRLSGSHVAVGPHVGELARGGTPNIERLRGREKELLAKVCGFAPICSFHRDECRTLIPTHPGPTSRT